MLSLSYIENTSIRQLQMRNIDVIYDHSASSIEMISRLRGDNLGIVDHITCCVKSNILHRYSIDRRGILDVIQPVFIAFCVGRTALTIARSFQTDPAVDGQVF